MKSNVIGSHKNKVISLSLALIILVVSTSPISSLQLIKPAMAAGTLTSVAILPTNNIVNTRTTYDVMFKTATSGTIKTIEINFVGIAASSFDINSATRLIERSGIGSGSLSVSGSILKYTVSSPVSVPSGTSIRLEIPRIVNPNLQGFYTVSITTKNTGGSIIDGPTSSPTFPIKAITSNDIVDSTITGNDISPGFMIKKTLQDTTAGHAHGWDPNDFATFFSIADNDFSSLDPSSVLVNINVDSFGSGICSVDNIFSGFSIRCDSPLPNGSTLNYIITKLPQNVVTSSTSVSTTSTPTDSTTSQNTSSTMSSPPQSTTTSMSSSSNTTSQYESVRAHDQIASEFR